ncbi:hypothetical protein FIBSPDRAFT_467199 [Athelia psychrophila]|uniref:Uncharacterized protein n=1 Tax=Athelia psychrophila TaxID=1759441 RepID=A0A167U4D8_9AGAM|nr:hypothetical protein FIBSPDRAFT_467199 [Fibularhizoctonia sp. CBS 109695]
MFCHRGQAVRDVACALPGSSVDTQAGLPLVRDELGRRLGDFAFSFLLGSGRGGSGGDGSSSSEGLFFLGPLSVLGGFLGGSGLLTGLVCLSLLDALRFLCLHSLCLFSLLAYPLLLILSRLLDSGNPRLLLALRLLSASFSTFFSASFTARSVGLRLLLSHPLLPRLLALHAYTLRLAAPMPIRRAIEAAGRGTGGREARARALRNDRLQIDLAPIRGLDRDLVSSRRAGRTCSRTCSAGVRSWCQGGCCCSGTQESRA